MSSTRPVSDKQQGQNPKRKDNDPVEPQKELDQSPTDEHDSQGDKPLR
jgi:hypothetical protein